MKDYPIHETKIRPFFKTCWNIAAYFGWTIGEAIQFALKNPAVRKAIQEPMKKRK